MNYSLNATMPIHCQRLHEMKSLHDVNRFDKQQGSSVVLALFVIVVLTLLGGILMNIISTSSETVSQEVLGTRAYMAANSAMQAELQKLFPLNGTDGCASASSDYIFATSAGDDVVGLYDCEASTQCEKYYPTTTSPQGGPNYYRITSIGKCGSSVMNASSKNIVNSSRTIQVEARSL